MAKEFAKQFYASKEWKATRKAILRRDLYTCADCMGRANEVHHKIELTPENIRNDLIRVGADNLMSLCHRCHTQRTLRNLDTDIGYYFDEDGQIVRQHGIK